MKKNAFVYIKDGDINKIMKKINNMNIEATFVENMILSEKPSKRELDSSFKTGFFSFLINALIKEKDKCIDFEKMDYIEDRFYSRFNSLCKAITKVIESDDEYYSS